MRYTNACHAQNQQPRPRGPRSLLHPPGQNHRDRRSVGNGHAHQAVPPGFGLGRRRAPTVRRSGLFSDRPPGTDQTCGWSHRDTPAVDRQHSTVHEAGPVSRDEGHALGEMSSKRTSDRMAPVVSRPRPFCPLLACDRKPAPKGIEARSVYSVTKADIRNLARTWAVELAGRRIRVDAISSGPIETPGLPASRPIQPRRPVGGCGLERLHLQKDRAHRRRHGGTLLLRG